MTSRTMARRGHSRSSRRRWSTRTLRAYEGRNRSRRHSTTTIKGVLSKHTYPSCAHCDNPPVRDVDYIYENGLLSQVLGGAGDDINAGFSYSRFGNLTEIALSGFSNAKNRISVSTQRGPARRDQRQAQRESLLGLWRTTRTTRAV